MGREGEKVHGAGISAQPSKGDGGNLALSSTESETRPQTANSPAKHGTSCDGWNYNWGGLVMSQHGA